jgi:hypothetical protein
MLTAPQHLALLAVAQSLSLFTSADLSPSVRKTIWLQISKTHFRPIELVLAIRTHRSAIEPIEPIERHSIGQNI